MERPICCYYEGRKKEVRDFSVSFNIKFSLVGTNRIKTFMYKCVPEGSKIRVKVVLKEETLNLFWKERKKDSRVFCHAISKG